MDKTELKRDMMQRTGQMFMTKADIRQAFGLKRDTAVEKYLIGLEAVDGKYFYIGDLAKVFKERCGIYGS